jgi:serine/threonine-protein kinase
VYALGAMTYEMLAGEPPFTGPNSQAIVAKVLTEQPPPLRARRPTVPPAAEAAIMTALHKLPADRWASAKEFGDALAGAGVHHSQAAPTVPTAVPSALARASGRSAALWLGWVVAGIALTVAAGALLRSEHELPPSRLAILAPGLGGSGASASQRHLTFEPDGQSLVYAMVATDGLLHLVRQPLDAAAPTAIPGAVQLSSPLVSPDGRWVVATQGHRSQVLRLPLEGGSPELAVRNQLTTEDAAWGPDGSLWISDPTFSRIGRVLGDSLAPIAGTGQHRVQQILPDGRTALAVRTRVGNATGPVLLVDLRDGSETALLETPVIEARITSGWLVSVSPGGNLQAAPLDRSGRRLVGPAVTVATDVAITGTAVAQFAVSSNGNVAYIPEEPYSLVFVDRAGSSRLATAERRNFHHPMFAPDGRRLSIDFSSIEGRNVWVLGLDEGTLTRASFDRDGHDATWTPDGRFITYIAPLSRPEGVTLVLLRKRPASAESPDTLIASRLLSYTGLWLRDGSALVTTATSMGRGTPDSADVGSRTDAAIVRNAGKGPIEPLVASPFAEWYVGASPDGRWISFVSDQSGRDEVYVRDLAGEQDQTLVSLEGGTEPVWSRDGRELFYRETRQGDPYLIAAGIRTSPTLAVTGRKRLFPVGDMVATNPHANYDLSPDGKTFVMVRRSPAARIVVIQNLPALVRRLQGQRSAR